MQTKNSYLETFGSIKELSSVNNLCIKSVGAIIVESTVIVTFVKEAWKSKTNLIFEDAFKYTYKIKAIDSKEDEQQEEAEEEEEQQEQSTESKSDNAKIIFFRIIDENGLSIKNGKASFETLSSLPKDHGFELQKDHSLYQINDQTIFDLPPYFATMTINYSPGFVFTTDDKGGSHIVGVLEEEGFIFRRLSNSDIPLQIVDELK